MTKIILPRSTDEGTVYLKDIKSNGVEGGTLTAGSWQRRIINSLSGDTSFVALTEGTTGVDGTNLEFTLQAGTYDIDIASPVYAALDSTSFALYNVTNTSYDLVSNNSPAAGGLSYNFIIKGPLVLTEATVFDVRIYSTTTQATFGLGRAGVATGINEVYTQIRITKLS